MNSKASIPVVPGRPLLGNLPAFRRDRIRLHHRVAREYGDIALAPMGLFDVVYASAPALAHEILVEKHDAFIKSRGLSLFARPLLGDGLLTSEREVHRRKRRLVAPALSHARVSAYADVMIERGLGALPRMLEGGPVDLDAETMRVTFEIVGKTLFDAEVGAAASVVGDALTEAMTCVTRSLTGVVPLPPAVPTPTNFRLRRAIRRLDRVVYDLIAERRARGSAGNDLLSMLLEARDENGDRLTDLEIRDEAMTMMLAGHETTANALAWTLYLLARNPEARARVESEIDGVLGGRPPVLADLQRLPLTLAAFKEAMRLYPPAYMVGRQATREVTIGGTTLPRGQTIFVNIAGIHRRPDLYPDPDRFEPERFLPERERALPRYAYLPFGAGPRICAGNHFAMMEGHLLLATWLGRATFELVHPDVEIGTAPLLTLRPADRVLMRVTERGRPVTALAS